MNFKNKVAWVIGASSGIGKAVAIEFAKLGSIIIISSHEKEELEKVKLECENIGAECFVQVLDLANQSNFEEITNIIINKYNRIDILINNGGISQRSLIKETSLDIDRKLMEINYFGNIALTKAVLPQMIKQNEGSIVTLSSIVGKFGFPLRSAYSASKHALHGFYETLRAEHKKDNLNVTIAIPGRVRTNISYNAILKDGTPNNKLDDGQKNGITSEDCAKQIIKAINRNKKEVLIGGKELLMVHLRRFLPSVFYRIVSKIKAT